MKIAALAACMMLGIASLAHAHSGGVSYVDLTPADGVWQAQIDLPLPDAAVELELDADGDGALRWAEVVAANARIHDRLARRLQVGTDPARPCTAREPLPLELVRRASGTHLRVQLHYDCAASPGTPTRLDAGAWLVEVPDHGLLVRAGKGPAAVAMLKTGTATLDLPVDGASHGGAAARRFLTLGIEHLITGYDHLAFLALLLIGVLRGADANPRRILRDTAVIITTFTIAHSVTLALAALEVLRLPAKWVEAAIAASILLTAVAMLLRREWKPDWRVAGAVGLVHGLGFASLLGELLDGRASALPLAAFNLGLEAAQLGLVLATLPLLMRLGRWPAWQARLAPAFTVLLAAGGGLWLWERV